MANLKVRYLVEKSGRDAPRFFWQPARALRTAGWEPQRLARAEIAALGGPAVCENYYLTARHLAIMAAERLNAEVDAWRRGEQPPRQTSTADKNGGPSGRVVIGTVGHLIRVYRASDELAALRPNTQRSYNEHLIRIEGWAGDTPLTAITAKMCRDYYKEKFKTMPRVAANTMAVLRLLFSFARLADLAPWSKENNPAASLQIKVPKGKPRIWEPEDVAAFVAAADAWAAIPSARR